MITLLLMLILNGLCLLCVMEFSHQRFCGLEIYFREVIMLKLDGVGTPLVTIVNTGGITIVNKTGTFMI